MNKKDILTQIDGIYGDINRIQSKIDDLCFLLVDIDNQVCELRADVEDMEDNQEDINES